MRQAGFKNTKIQIKNTNTNTNTRTTDRPMMLYVFGNEMKIGV